MAVFEEDGCVAAFSNALDAMDPELADIVPAHIARLIAAFVPYERKYY